MTGGEPADPELELLLDPRLGRELEVVRARWREDFPTEGSAWSDAFWHAGNVLVLLSAGLASVASGVLVVPSLALVGVALTCVWEVAWLTTLARSPRFRRSARARRRQQALHAAARRRERSLRGLPREAQRRHRVLAQLAHEIRVQAEEAELGELDALEDTLAKLDYLLKQHARLLMAHQRVEAHHCRHKSEDLIKRIRATEKELEVLESGRLRAAKQQQLAVLHERLERARHGREERDTLATQAETLEMTLELVRDQVISATSSRRIATSLDRVILELAKHRSFMVQVEAELERIEAEDLDPVQNQPLPTRRERDSKTLG